MPRNKFEVATHFSDDLEYLNFTLRHGNEQTEIRKAYFGNSDFPIRPYDVLHWAVNAIRQSRQEMFDLREYKY